MASIITNAAFASAGRVLFVALGLVITALLTRILGTAIFGDYVTLVAYGLIWQVACDFGLYLTLTREAAKDSSQEQNVYENIFSVRILLIGIFSLLFMIMLKIIPAGNLPWWLFGIIWIGLIFQSLSQLLIGLFQVHAVMWRATVGDIAGRIAQVCGLLLIAILGIAPETWSTNRALTLAGGLFTLSTGVAYGVHALLVPRVRVFSISHSPRDMFRYISQSWPLAALLMLNVVYFRSGTVILAAFRTSEEVGWYGLAYRIIESALFFPAMFGGLLLPRITEWLRNNRARAREMLEQSLLFILIAAGFAGISLIGFAEPFIILISGEEFRQAVILLQILSLALVIMFFGNIFGFVLIGLERQRELFLLYLVLVVFNVVANIIFIPLFGSIAAAWITVGTEFIAAGIAGYRVWRAAPYKISLYSIIAVLSAVVGTYMLIIVVLPAWHILFALPAALLFYVAFGVMSGIINRRNFIHLVRVYGNV